MIEVFLTLVLIASVAFNIYLKSNLGESKKQLDNSPYKARLKEYEASLKIRKGYIEYTLQSRVTQEKWSVPVHIIEIDRYTNGKSLIEIDHINVTVSNKGEIKKEYMTLEKYEITKILKNK